MKRELAAVAFGVAVMAAGPSSILAAPRRSGTLVPQVTDGNVVIDLVNASGAHPSIHITVALDGKPIISTAAPDEYFEYRFAWPPGEHELRVESKDWKATEVKHVVVKGATWITIAYGWPTTVRGFWIVPDDKPTKWE